MRCVIVAGAQITNYKLVKSVLQKEDFFLFCDSGLNHAKKLGIKPDLIVGDFDSFTKSRKAYAGIETIQLPCEKDDTDSFYAVKEAIKRGFSDFLIVGVVGQRFDHTMANISILLYLHQQNKKALLLDDYSQMYVISKGETAVIPSSFKFFSTINIDGTAKGITIKDAKYPLEKAEINPWYQYGISNEIKKPSTTAQVTVEEGNLLIICDY